jgi:hypothetical protein
MVRMERLELSRREALEPKSSVSTNSTTSACRVDGLRYYRYLLSMQVFFKSF